jgi:hypothetical protein
MLAEVVEERFSPSRRGHGRLLSSVGVVALDYRFRREEEITSLLIIRRLG